MHTFDQFWALYPRKIGKYHAQIKWNRLEEDEKGEIMKDIPRRSRSEAWENKKYIPHPTTYLNGKRWQDEFEEENNFVKF